MKFGEEALDALRAYLEGLVPYAGSLVRFREGIEKDPEGESADRAFELDVQTILPASTYGERYTLIGLLIVRYWPTGFRSEDVNRAVNDSLFLYDALLRFRDYALVPVDTAIEPADEEEPMDRLVLAWIMNVRRS